MVCGVIIYISVLFFLFPLIIALRPHDFHVNFTISALGKPISLP